MNTQHQNLANGRWQTFSLAQQLGNIGSEVGRALSWKKKGDSDQENKALYRALELFDLSLSDARWDYPKLKEIARAREVVCDFFCNGNDYNSTPEFLDSYFLDFGILARSQI